MQSLIIAEWQSLWLKLFKSFCVPVMLPLFECLSINMNSDIQIKVFRLLYRKAASISVASILLHVSSYCSNSIICFCCAEYAAFITVSKVSTFGILLEFSTCRIHLDYSFIFTPRIGKIIIKWIVVLTIL